MVYPNAVLRSPGIVGAENPVGAVFTVVLVSG
jgi:hypothetical protein